MIPAGESLNGPPLFICVPSKFNDWRGESPRPNLMEVKGSEAQEGAGDGGSKEAWSKAASR